MAKNKLLIVAIIDRNTSQIVLAKKAGIHETRLSKIVNGHIEPTPDEKKAIARALRTPVTVLFPEKAA